jgi:hypothetical protein
VAAERPGDDNHGVIGSLSEFLEALEGIVERAVQEEDRLGYFAALYRKVTSKAAEGIRDGFFDDGPRMERLAVGFANRYLTAMERFRAGEPATRSWQVSFEAARTWRPLIVQHLLLGVNAHINLDLGISAAETAPGDTLPALRRDFDRVNELLSMLIHQVLVDVAEVSPAIGLLDRIGGRRDEEVIRFSVEAARTGAWRFATELSALPRDSWGGPISARDARVGRVGRIVLDPGLLTFGLLFIRAAESSDVPRVIDVLNSIPAPDLAEVDRRVHLERATEE